MKGKIFPNEHKVGDWVQVINDKPLPTKDFGPTLEMDAKHQVQEIYVCECGQEHIHVGVQSKLNWVTCYSCTKVIPGGESKAWCHPSRFIKA